MTAPFRPTDLAVPDARSNTTRTVLSGALGRLCRELPATLRAHAEGDLREDALAIGGAVARIARQEPGALASLLRRPHASTLVRVLRSAEPGRAPELAAELLAVLALDLAWIGALPQSVTLRHLPARIISLTAPGALTLPPGVQAVTFAAGRVVCERAGASDAIDLRALERGASHGAWSRPHRPLAEGIVLALADNNPLSDIEAHPDKTTPNEVDLGGHPEEEWVERIREALSTVERTLPGVANDVRVILQQVVPTGFHPEKHLSCSYQEDIGTIYLSLHPSLLTMAEALIHEVSHNKLNALLDLDPILLNRREELYASPVRPDPRPIHGVLLAVHAFVPVACMYEAMLTDVAAARSPGEVRSLEARLAAVVASNRAGTEVLRRHARPTPVGEALLEELYGWDRHFRARG